MVELYQRNSKATKAVDVNEHVKIDEMNLTEIELEIGLTPSAKLIFRKDSKINLIN